MNTAIGTITGGAGIDTIGVAASAAAGTSQSAIETGGGIFTLTYSAGDVINLISTAAGGSTLSNGTVQLMGADGASGGSVSSITAAGTLGVYSDNTDTWFAFSTGAGSAIVFKVAGADLVTTTATGTAGSAVNVGVTTATFGFTVGGTAATGLTITLS